MKCAVVLISLFLFAGCDNKSLQIPIQPAIYASAGPIYLDSDTTVIPLKSYFYAPEKIQKIKTSAGLKHILDRKGQNLKLYAADSLKSFFNLTIHQEGYIYDIPVLRTKHTSNDKKITTAGLQHDTIQLHSPVPVKKWHVYLDHYKLNEQLLHQDTFKLKFVIPEESSVLPFAKLNIWAIFEKGHSQRLILPIQNGTLITESRQLDSLAFCSQKWHQQLARYNIYQPIDVKKLTNILSINLLQDTLPDLQQTCTDTLMQQAGNLDGYLSHHMALLAGDFIPLRNDKHTFAFLRAYFGKEVIVITNKEDKMLTLKLDLPSKYRETNFKALFGNRFSYNNSRLLVDVPAEGLEIIYN